MKQATLKGNVWQQLPKDDPYGSFEVQRYFADWNWWRKQIQYFLKDCTVILLLFPDISTNTRGICFACSPLRTNVLIVNSWPGPTDAVAPLLQKPSGVCVWSERRPWGNQMVCNLLKVRTAGLSSAGLSSARGKALRFIKTRKKRISLNSTRPKQPVIVVYYNNAFYFLLIK